MKKTSNYLINQFINCQTLQEYNSYHEYKEQNKDICNNLDHHNGHSDSRQGSNKYLNSDHLKEFIKQNFPKIPQSQYSMKILTDDSFYNKFRYFVEIYSGIINLNHQIDKKSQDHDKDKNQFPLPSQKKITRAAIARRDQRVQEQLKKDQIYVRLIPRSQSCMQFMLSNRNFPRIECKLSCNQHVEYLVNYLTNKWIRGKIGYKILLYPDTSTFLKNLQPKQRQKVLYQPLNNFLMFTDIMVGSQIQQNGTIELIYDVIEIGKQKKIIKNKDIQQDCQSNYSKKNNNKYNNTPIIKQKKINNFIDHNSNLINLTNNNYSINLLQSPPQNQIKSQINNIPNQSSLFPDYKSNFLDDSMFGFHLQSINHNNTLVLNINSNSCINKNNNANQINKDNNNKLDSLRDKINAVGKQQIGQGSCSGNIQFGTIKQQHSISLNQQLKTQNITKQVKTVNVIKKKIIQ